MAKTDDGRSRLVVRFPYEDAVLIARAAAAVKTGVSEFVVQAAVDRARRVLKQSRDADLTKMQGALAKVKRKT